MEPVKATTIFTETFIAPNGVDVPVTFTIYPRDERMLNFFHAQVSPSFDYDWYIYAAAGETLTEEEFFGGPLAVFEGVSWTSHTMGEHYGECLSNLKGLIAEAITRYLPAPAPLEDAIGEWMGKYLVSFNFRTSSIHGMYFLVTSPESKEGYFFQCPITPEDYHASKADGFKRYAVLLGKKAAGDVPTRKDAAHYLGDEAVNALIAIVTRKLPADPSDTGRPVAVWVPSNEDLFSNVSSPLEERACRVLTEQGYEVKTVNPNYRPENGRHLWRLVLMTASAGGETEPAIVAGNVPMNMLGDYLNAANGTPLLSWDFLDERFERVVSVRPLTTPWGWTREEAELAQHERAVEEQAAAGLANPDGLGSIDLDDYRAWMGLPSADDQEDELVGASSDEDYETDMHAYDDEEDLRRAERGGHTYEGWDYSDEERVMQMMAAEAPAKPTLINLDDANKKPFPTMNPACVVMTDDGRTDGGAYHRALAIARAVKQLGYWGGETMIFVADPYAIYDSLDHRVTVAHEPGYDALVVRKAQVCTACGRIGCPGPEEVDEGIIECITRDTDEE